MPEPHPYIMLVDDDTDDLEMLSSSFNDIGIRTRSFDSGEKAIYYLQLIADTNDLPALIISDYNMPRINGEEMLENIKSNKNTKDIPVVVYSTGMSRFSKKKLIDLGAIDCFTKADSYQEFTTQVGVFKNIMVRSEG